jgi:hypothetical protein
VDILGDKGDDDFVLDGTETLSNQLSKLGQLAVVQIVPFRHGGIVFLHGGDCLFCIEGPHDIGDGCDDLSRMIHDPNLALFGFKISSARFHDFR